MTKPHVPPLCEAGHVVCLSANHLLLANGGGALTRNLLSLFDAESYTVGVLDTPDADKSLFGANVRPLMRRRTARGRVNSYLYDLELPLAELALKNLVREKNAVCIVGVYPTYHFLKMARDVARSLSLPWLAYVQDALVESSADTPLALRAVKLQEQTFAECSSLMVMSQGMAELYQKEYHQASTPLEHCYPEEMPADSAGFVPEDAVLPQAFWGGSIYHMNDKSLKRVAQAVADNGLGLLVTTRASREALAERGLDDEGVQSAVFPERADYIDAVSRRRMLVLALNWPDETSIMEGEVSTVFPTKTIEYLISGRPIIVHCPEHYFLARFFREHKCGLVVSERSQTALDEAVKQLCSGGPAVDAMREAALKAARLFDRTRVSSLFAENVAAVSRAAWGQKIA